MIDPRGNIPGFIHVSDGKLADVNALDLLVSEAGAIYVMDRGYGDFSRLNRLHRAGAFFVTWAKSNMRSRRMYSAPPDRKAGIVCDQTVALVGLRAKQNYPERLRRVRYRDAESGQTLIVLTNHFERPALTVAALHRNLWQVALFVNWIKPHPRIERFCGASENAAKTQAWIAVSVTVLVAIVKKRLALDASLYTSMQVISMTVFEKMPIQTALSGGSFQCDTVLENKQLNLFAY